MFMICMYHDESVVVYQVLTLICVPLFLTSCTRRTEWHLFGVAPSLCHELTTLISPRFGYIYLMRYFIVSDKWSAHTHYLDVISFWWYTYWQHSLAVILTVAFIWMIIIVDVVWTGYSKVNETDDRDYRRRGAWIRQWVCIQWEFI